jgi:hypothetical protein
MGRLRAQLGRRNAARAAFAEAASIIRYIAENVDDERLRQIFLSSDMVREALAGEQTAAPESFLPASSVG